jgi:hypothetical protein
MQEELSMSRKCTAQAMEAWRNSEQAAREAHEVAQSHQKEGARLERSFKNEQECTTDLRSEMEALRGQLGILHRWSGEHAELLGLPQVPTKGGEQLQSILQEYRERLAQVQDCMNMYLRLRAVLIVGFRGARGAGTAQGRTHGTVR